MQRLLEKKTNENHMTASSLHIWNPWDYQQLLSSDISFEVKRACFKFNPKAFQNFSQIQIQSIPMTARLKSRSNNYFKILPGSSFSGGLFSHHLTQGLFFFGYTFHIGPGLGGRTCWNFPTKTVVQL